MKRRTALIITVILFALISVCFLRPAPNDGRVFRPSDRHELKLIGKDAHLLKAYMYDCYTEGSAMLHFQSADPDRYYTIGLAPWREGRQTFTPGDISGHINFRSLGMFYRLEDGKWVEFGEARDAEPGRFLQFTGEPDRLVTPGEGGQFSSMPFDTPGRYRVMYTFYEYFLSENPTSHSKYSMGSSGSERYEAGFEFTVPEASDEPVEPICVSTRQYGSDNCTRIYIGYRINSGRAFYPQVDSIKFEKQSGSGYKNIESLGEYRDLLQAEIWHDAYDEDEEAFCVDAQYIQQCIVERIYEFEKYGDGEIPDTMCLNGVYGFELKEGAVYRLRVTFTEHEDGSGELYEASVKFRID